MSHCTTCGTSKQMEKPRAVMMRVVHSKVYCRTVSQLRGGFVLIHIEMMAYIAVP
jgi:hypothetical protein